MTSLSHSTTVSISTGSDASEGQAVILGQSRSQGSRAALWGAHSPLQDPITFLRSFASAMRMTVETTLCLVSARSNLTLLRSPHGN